MFKIFKKKQRTFCYCPKCNNELISSNSLILDSVWVYFKCAKCKLVTKWDFDLPVPMLIDELEEKE